MATAQHRPHGAFAGPLFGTLDGKTEDTTPAVEVKTQHRPHGGFAGPRFGTLSGKGSSSAATISAVYGTPLSGTTATVGCTTDTASGTLAIVVTQSSTTPSVAQIKAGTDENDDPADWATSALAVSSTSPSTTATGLTAATTYYTHAVQTVSAVDSNAASSSSWITDTVGGGGGYIGILVPLGTLSLNGYAPTVTTSNNKIIAVPAGSLTLTGYAPTVTTDNNKVISVPVGTLTLTGYAPTVKGTTNIIEVPAGTLALTGYAPTVTNGETESGGGKKRRKGAQRAVVGNPYTREEYMQWVVRTVAAVAATGVFDA